MKTPLILLALLAAAPTAAADDDPAARAAALLAREGEALDALDDLDRRIAEVALEQARLAVQHTARRDALRDVDARLAETRAERDATRDRLTVRLRARARQTAALDRLPALTADPRALLRRRGVLRAILRADLELLRQLRDRDATLTALRAERAEAAAAFDAADAAFTAQRHALEDERQTRAALLATLRGERRLAERLAAARTARLDALPLTADPPGQSDFAAHRGRLTPPVPGRLAAPFGRATDPELGTVTFNTGVTLDAPYGTPVRAVHRGRVVYSGWYKGFGNLVIIDHGDDYHTLYGHLSAIRRARGEVVDAGTIIGEVGDAGSLRGPQLHFELRARRHPVDPLPWLRGY